ncbi:MAG: cysteine desulfurase [Actinobacteria bacterium]|nr:cysteine desulfurase [Actinomycetota bacterium]
MAMKPIYLDYNATTPIDPEAIDAMTPFLKEHFGNPSSSHCYGQKAKQAVEKARVQVADFLNCNTDEIIFTSGGTESNNYAIKGTAFTLRDKGNHIITTQIEHPSVLESCKSLESKGFEVTYLPVNELGLINLYTLEKAITPKTILITIMHSNNEVGTIQPIEQVSGLAKKYNIIFHTDAVQSAGKIPVKVTKLGINMLSIAGHKIYAPKGVGALYIQKGTKLEKLILGAGQENNTRAGTENVLEIVGLGKACEIAGRDLDKNAAKMRIARDRLYNELKKKIRDLKLNSQFENCLPNTLSLSFKNIDANLLLNKINNQLAVSSGAACHSNKSEVSGVLKALNVPYEWAKGTIRFSTGKMTTADEIDNAVDIVTNTFSNLQNYSEKGK